MRVRRFGALIGAGIALSLALAACGSDTEKTEATTVLQKAQNEKKLTIGIKFDQPALGLKKPDGTFEGFDVDVAKYIAKEMGVPEDGITFKETTSANRESFIGGGQVDLVVATYSITEARKEQVTFGGPYYVAHQDTMVNADNNDIKKTADLKGKRLCKAAGSNSFRRITDPPPDGQLDIDGVTARGRPELLRVRQQAQVGRAGRGQHRRPHPRRVRQPAAGLRSRSSTTPSPTRSTASA